MSGADAEPRIVRISKFRGRLLDGPSPVETGNAAGIEAVWRKALADKPQMYDGRVLLGETLDLTEGVLSVGFRETSYATLIWLKQHAGADAGLVNVFGAAAVVSRDGAALVGRMAAHTANAGQVYFPCGTPDLGDVRGGEVDIEGSIVRELAEETGLKPPVVRPGRRAVAVFDGEIVGFIRRFDSDLDADALAARARRHLGAEADPELDRIVMVRSADELGPEAPRYARLALGALLGD